MMYKVVNNHKQRVLMHMNGISEQQKNDEEIITNEYENKLEKKIYILK